MASNNGVRDFWFKRIGGKINKKVTPWVYSGGDITRIDEVPDLWREEVRALISEQEEG